jgi:hypothetical protein
MKQNDIIVIYKILIYTPGNVSASDSFNCFINSFNASSKNVSERLRVESEIYWDFSDELRELMKETCKA